MVWIVPITVFVTLTGAEIVRFPHSYFCGIQCSYTLWSEIKDADILTQHLIQASHRCQTEDEAKDFEAECLSVIPIADEAVSHLLMQASTHE